jgi:hypothetical protein
MLVISFTLRLFTPGERVPHIQWMGGHGDLLVGLHAVATFRKRILWKCWRAKKLDNGQTCSDVGEDTPIRLWFTLDSVVRWKSTDISEKAKLEINMKQKIGTCFMLSLALLILRTWWWRRYVPSKRWLTFKRTIRRYISDERTLHNHLCENLSSYW